MNGRIVDLGQDPFPNQKMTVAARVTWDHEADMAQRAWVMIGAKTQTSSCRHCPAS